MRIAEAQVFVTDLNAAEEFYSRTLGFPLKSKGSNWLLFEPGLEFVVMSGAKEKKSPGPYGSRADTVVCLEVDGIESVVIDLEKKGVSFLTEIKSVPQGKFASFTDLDGNLFELIERPTPKTFLGMIVEESLVDPTFMNDVAVQKVQITDLSRWHIYTVIVSEAQILQHQKNMKEGPWYMHFWHGAEIIAVFREKSFRFSKNDKVTWVPAITFGKSIGIPEEQLDFLTERPGTSL